MAEGLQVAQVTGVALNGPSLRAVHGAAETSEVVSSLSPGVCKQRLNNQVMRTVQKGRSECPGPQGGGGCGGCRVPCAISPRAVEQVSAAPEQVSAAPVQMRERGVQSLQGSGDAGVSGGAIERAGEARGREHAGPGHSPSPQQSA